MKKEVRIVHSYCMGEETVFTLGYVSYLKAHPPLKMHQHGNMMEFVYVVKGRQIYQVDGQSYTVEKGNVFFTNPYEEHTTGTYPEEVSVIYYLIINLPILKELGIFLTDEEYDYFEKQWKQQQKRTFKASDELLNVLERLLSCFDRHDTYYDSRIRNTLSEVLITMSYPQYANTNKCRNRIINSLEYIHNHLDESIRVSMLAEMDFMSISAYNKIFIEATGVSPGEYVLKLKIEKAKELLCKTDLSVTDIAYKLGFSSSQYFATVFKRFCCETPKAYRNREKR